MGKSSIKSVLVGLFAALEVVLSMIAGRGPL